ncbi:hypothetical protein C8R47DRAFT_1090043 [Mycena vitilis]|nr:hypothetical protein C8R47DRAFT_1090043 [Mycena vitilis]
MSAASRSRIVAAENLSRHLATCPSLALAPTLTFSLLVYSVGYPFRMLPIPGLGCSELWDQHNSLASFGLSLFKPKTVPLVTLKVDDKKHFRILSLYLALSPGEHPFSLSPGEHRGNPLAYTYTPACDHLRVESPTLWNDKNPPRQYLSP